MNSKGFTFIEILITTGAIGFSLVAWLALSDSMKQGLKHNEAQTARDSLTRIVNQTLKYKSTCDTALATTGLNSVSSVQILNGTQELKMLIPGILGDADASNDVIQKDSVALKLQITDIRMVNVVTIDANQYFGQIRLSVQEQNSERTFKPIDSSGFYFTLSGAQISGCEIDTLDVAGLCKEMGCEWTSVNPHCQCKSVDVSCPSSQILTGIDASGGPICSRLGNGPCPSGQYLTELRIGERSCSPLASSVAAVNGGCGTASGSSASSAPTASLCSAGTASAVTGSGPWSWTCAGSNGGSTASCPATLAASNSSVGKCQSGAGANCTGLGAECASGVAGNVSSSVSGGVETWTYTCGSGSTAVNCSCITTN